MVEDMTAFFSPQEFAVAATLDDVAVLGILDQPYEQVLDGIATTGPVFALPAAQAAGARQGSWLVVGPARYRVRSVQLDGVEGVTTLVLEAR